MNKVLFSHSSDDWKTPKYIYDYFMKSGCIDLFPFHCSYNQYKVNYFDKCLFCNPPYSQMNKVVDYIINQFFNNNEIWLLVPSRTDTKWFHKLLCYNPDIYFIEGRLKFNEFGSAPFPSILIHLIPNGSHFMGIGGCWYENFIMKGGNL